VRPYILRRLKTDKTVIADLPDKTEVKAFCQLSRKQAALYKQAVEELAEALDGAEGIQRKGLVLVVPDAVQADLQPPVAVAGRRRWSEEDSGKWARLRDIAEVIAAKQEKVLVFTQFREMTLRSRRFWDRFRAPGLVLHGETEVKKRKDLVRRFQEEEGCGILRAFSQSGRRRPQPHCRIACGSLRPLVEPGGGEPSHGPRFPHRTKQERAGAQVRVPGNGRGKDRPNDRIKAAAFEGLARGRRRPAPDGIERPRTAKVGGAGSQYGA
jgi:hypothetical protein